jgi:hypothetical protein
VLALLGAAHLPIVRARAFEWARTQAAQRLGIVVDADAVAYNLATASVALRNVRLAAAGEPPFFRADSVRVVLGRSVLWGAVRIERLDVGHPFVSIVRHRNGTTNLPAGNSDASSQPSPLRLGLVDLRTFSVALNDEMGGQSFTAGPIDLTLETSAAVPRSGAFGPSAFTAKLAATGNKPSTRSLTGTLAGRLGFDGSRLSVPELSVETREARLALNGWIDLLTTALRSTREDDWRWIWRVPASSPARRTRLRRDRRACGSTSAVQRRTRSYVSISTHEMSATDPSPAAVRLVKRPTRQDVSTSHRSTSRRPPGRRTRTAR